MSDDMAALPEQDPRSHPPIRFADLPRMVRGVKVASAIEAEDDGITHPSETPEDGDNRRRLARVIVRSEPDIMIAVDADMVSLVVDAANDLPECHLGRDLWPANSGLVVFQTPIDLPGFAEPGIERQFRRTIRGVYWTLTGNEVHMAMLDDVRQWVIDDLMLFSGIEHPDDAQVERVTARVVERVGFNPRLMIRAIATQPLDESLDWERTGIQNPSCAFIMSTLWLLMQNDGIATQRVERLPGRERRRAARQGVRVPEVRVIEIRSGTAAAGAHSADAATRAYHHRWMVRGHWRRQWVPSLNMHRPTYIAPYIKGPEGAPLLTGEKVHRWAGR